MTQSTVRLSDEPRNPKFRVALELLAALSAGAGVYAATHDGTWAAQVTAVVWAALDLIRRRRRDT